MTGPDDSHGNTRPISVAELLAKNGTIGAPPVGGRRRRRRGDSDSVTVAELTGEIPIVRDHEVVDHGAADADVRDVEDVREPETGRTRAITADDEVAPERNGAVERHDQPDADAGAEPAGDVDETEAGQADAVAEYTAHVQQRDADADLDFFTPARRSSFAPRRFGTDVSAGAEQMSPDPVDDSTGFDGLVEVAQPEADGDVRDVRDFPDVDADDDREEAPSYLRSSAGTLFGGQTVADDLARRGSKPTIEDLDYHLDRDELEDTAPAREEGMSSFVRAAWVVGQCVLAVAFGAGLFIAFDQLWKWNNIVALMLSVLVILGLVVGVRVVRKTEDIGSTLIAVAVGALVTLGPLALLQSG